MALRSARQGRAIDLTRWLACVGLANIFLLAEWQRVILAYRPAVAYFGDGRLPLTYAWSTGLAVLIFGSGFAAVSWLLENLTLPVHTGARDRLAVTAATVALIGAWAGATAFLLPASVRMSVVAALTLVGLGCAAHPRATVVRRGASRLAAWASMLVPLFVGNALIAYATYPEGKQGLVERSDAAAHPSGRVVWIVFDELDAAVAIHRRPPGLRLPAFDRLRAESFEATQAYAPGRWTLDALPTLWTGRPVTEARESGPQELRLTFAGSPEPLDFDPSTSVFGLAHKAGFRVGIAGWYHPYCRLFGSVADPCRAVVSVDAFSAVRSAMVASEGGTVSAVRRLIGWHVPWSVASIRAGGFTPSRLHTEEAYVLASTASAYRQIHDRSLEMVRDPTLSLVFVHYPVPHLPAFSTVTDSSGPLGYEDNLTLMDRALGELRVALEGAGLWTKTTLIVHSDHALRPQLWKDRQMWTPSLEEATGGRQGSLTPFIVKMAGSRDEPVEYLHPFTAALTHDLVLGVLDGRIQSSPGLTAWLDDNRTRLPLTWPVRTLADR